MTGEAWYLGDDPQRAAAYKIFGNSLLFVITAGVADVFAMAKDLGIPTAEALTVFSKFQPCGVIKARGDKMARRDFSASFELTMARKDMRLMLEAAGAPAADGAAGDREENGRSHCQRPRRRRSRGHCGGGRVMRVAQSAALSWRSA